MKKTKNIIVLFFFVLFFAGIMPKIGHAQTIVKKKSLFLTETERERLMNLPSDSPTASLLSAMQLRVKKRVASPGLVDPSATNEWWHLIGEYLTDAALIHAVRPTEEVDAWLRAMVLSVVNRPVSDWAGPPFRGYNGGEMTGGLETGHLSWAIAIAYDLGSDLFTASEKDEIFTALKEKGMIPCERYLERTNFFHNWNCVILAGFTVSAAVLGDEDALAKAAKWLPVVKDHFQPDGSYGESLQYANYAAYSIMLAHEALLRSNSQMKVSLEPYGRMASWSSYALFHRKPLSGWPIMDWPRSANFGDAAAVFRPSGDLLVHIAARAKHEMPEQAGLASWLFNTLYFPANEPGPHDLASFGLVNDFGFLSVILLADAAPAISPKKDKLPLTVAFSGGDAFARDSWDGKTILAARIPAEPRHALAHLHGDMNSFILVHNKERLLVDPGHSCYRNITREIDTSTSSHNTCTFEIPATETSPARSLSQHGGGRRALIHENSKIYGAAPVDVGGSRLITSREGQVSVIGADAAPLYGAPLRKFERFFVLCGSNVLFIVDHIEADVPIRTTWNWLLNNRDGLLQYDFGKSGSITARRGDAGVKITHYGTGRISGPVYSLMHDAYHPLPAQRGEGQPGSGIMMHWSEKKPIADRTVVHALAVDSQSGILGWSSSATESTYTMQNSDLNEKWSLRLNDDGSFTIDDAVLGQAYSVTNSDGIWSLTSKNTVDKKK
jgi:hypothetical protein